MSTRKIYFTEEEHESELEAFRNIDDNLFVCLSSKGYPDLNNRYIALHKKDAIALISELAFDFGLVDDNPEHEGKMIWQGNPR
jgi:hypothetical protein